MDIRETVGQLALSLLFGVVAAFLTSVTDGGLPSPVNFFLTLPDVTALIFGVFVTVVTFVSLRRGYGRQYG